MRGIGDEVAPGTFQAHFPGDVPDDRQALGLSVRDDLHGQLSAVHCRRGDADRVAPRILQMTDEIGISDQVVDALPHVGRKVQPQQPHARPVAPQNLVSGIQDDAAVVQCPGGLPDLPQQAPITLLAVPRLGP